MQRVLVLDDEPEIGKLVVRVANKLGFEARAVTSAAEFLDEVATWVPTLLVIDLLVPEQDGVELLRKLADSGYSPSIILISGVSDRVLDAARRAANEKGLHVLHAINKPFSASAVKAALVDSAAVAPEDVPHEQSPPSMPSTDYRDLQRAIVEQEIGIALLPKIDCRSHRVVGFEALARWSREGGLQFRTEDFIACFERNGLIRALSNTVFEQAMQWLSRLDPVDRPMLCLNLSPLLLREHDFAENLAETAGRFGIDTSGIVLELAEHSVMNDLEQAMPAITSLCLRGFRMAIEDVGSRYGSLVILARLPLSEMKIDRSFVKSIATNAESRAITESLVVLGHNLGLKVIAEGVESSEADRFLGDVGCDMAQGYFYGRPMAPAAASEWLARRRAFVSRTNARNNPHHP